MTKWETCKDCSWGEACLIEPDARCRWRSEAEVKRLTDYISYLRRCNTKCDKCESQDCPIAPFNKPSEDGNGLGSGDKQSPRTGDGKGGGGSLNAVGGDNKVPADPAPETPVGEVARVLLAWVLSPEAKAVIRWYRERSKRPDLISPGDPPERA